MSSRTLRLIGLMSGTSADGVDAALVDVQGVQRPRIHLHAWIDLPFTTAERQRILDACSRERSSAENLCIVHALVAEKYAEAARAVARKAALPLRSVDALCAHGQTVWHQPEPVQVGTRALRSTLQLGSAPVLAERTGCAVISDFRSADLAAGGQGAPLVPFADWALLGSSCETRAILNIGGIANLTLLPRAARLTEVVAFDTGPGNMLMDEIVRRATDGREQYDRDGRWAGRGCPHEGLVTWMHAHAAGFLALQPPKSTGRELFGEPFVHALLKEAAVRRVAVEDVLASAARFTVEAICLGLRASRSLDRVIVGGGGGRNRTLMRMLREAVHPVPVEGVERHGIPSEAKEAIAFALLGHQTLLGRPSNVPSATGARRRVVLGTLTPGRSARPRATVRGARPH